MFFIAATGSLISLELLTTGPGQRIALVAFKAERRLEVYARSVAGDEPRAVRLAERLHPHVRRVGGDEVEAARGRRERAEVVGVVEQGVAEVEAEATLLGDRARLQDEERQQAPRAVEGDRVVVEAHEAVVEGVGVHREEGGGAEEEAAGSARGVAEDGGVRGAVGQQGEAGLEQVVDDGVGRVGDAAGAALRGVVGALEGALDVLERGDESALSQEGERALGGAAKVSGDVACGGVVGWQSGEVDGVDLGPAEDERAAHHTGRVGAQEGGEGRWGSHAEALAAGEF